MPGRGGAETYANTVRAGLSAAGDEVRLLTSRTGSVADRTADFVAYATEQFPLQAALQVANPFAAAQARAAVRTFRPDVALVHLFASLSVAGGSLAASRRSDGDDDRGLQDRMPTRIEDVA